MPPEPPRVWTTGRRLAGNLVPLGLALPFFLWAMVELAFRGATWTVVWAGLGFFVVGWLGTNFLGLWGNGWMKRQLETRFRSLRPDDTAERFFVGFARPQFKNMLDPHEDVGFLVLGEDEAEFWGSELQFSMPWSVVTGVRRRGNIHSWLGLGGWVSLEGEVAGKPVRMLLEAREQPTLLGNRGAARRLLAALEAKIGAQQK